MCGKKLKSQLKSLVIFSIFEGFSLKIVTVSLTGLRLFKNSIFLLALTSQPEIFSPDSFNFYYYLAGDDLILECFDHLSSIFGQNDKKQQHFVLTNYR